MEDDGVVNPVEELRPEVLLELFRDLVLRPLVVADAALSKSCASIDSFSRRTSAIRSSNSRRSGGAVIRRMRMRDPASSIRSIALSGRNRSEIYRSAKPAGRYQGRIGDRHSVVRLVPVTQSLEDLDGVRNGRLAYLHRLESPF
jgi:hypothetical protein